MSLLRHALQHIFLLWMASLTSALWASQDTINLPFFTRSQSVLEEFQNLPLISGNWEGRFRPYLYANEKLQPLFTKEQSIFYAEFDFLNPLPISDNHLLLYGEKNGEPGKTIFTFDAISKKLQEIPLPEVSGLMPNWHLHVCAEKNNALFSYPQKTEQAFFKINLSSNALTPIQLKQTPPPFIKCIWEHADQLFGVAKTKLGYQLYQCDLNEKNIQCTAQKALDPFLEFTDFFVDKARLGIIGLKRGENFRKPYYLSEKHDDTLEINIPKKLMGDVVEVKEGHFRVGLLSRYVTDLTEKPDPNAIIARINRINGHWYAIATDVNHTRTLAVLENEKWQLRKFNTMPLDFTIAKPQEIWTTSEKGARYQSFYYGKANAENIIVWLHGGPQESFSPRFHPYAYQLNQMGYGMLAVNYPGSTGRGAAFEYIRDEATHIDSIKSVFAYLKQQKAQRVIVWSLSYADKLQKEILENNLPVSAIIDDVGILPQDSLKILALQKNVPYFAIRGKFDHLSKSQSPNFLFESGGHGMTNPHDFELLFTALTPFLAKANTWTY